MRLARLAALGLAIGVIAGFAAALLRPRPQVLVAEGIPVDPFWEQFRKAEQLPAVDLRSAPRVIG